MIFRAAKLLLDHWEAFSWDGNFGATTLIEHKIYTKDGPPINERYRPLNPDLEAKLLQQIKEWLDHDVIEPSNSPYNFGLVAVPKKNGTVRWAVDFRPLNKISQRDTYPIGNISDNLSRLSNSKVFSGLDGSGAFHVIPLEHSSKPKTAFSTPFGTFHFKRLPFGLANGPSTYARLVKMVLHGIPLTVAIPYLDDILVHSDSVEKHFDSLQLVLSAYMKAGLKLQPAKCHLFQSKINYLGHTVSKEGIAPMPEYLEIVKQWPMPSTRNEVRIFLGKTGYYRRFIKDYAKKAKPLYEKLAKDGIPDKQKFIPDKNFQHSFQELKQALLTAPILAYPQFSSEEPFILDTDWSMENGAIGACLSQKQDGKEKVIAYAARKLSQSQLNYAPTKGELYAVIYFIDYFKYYLAMRKFILRTDHMALKYMHTMQEPSGMVQRWLHTLSTYHFDIEHRAGKRHSNADSLSRAPHIPANDDTETLTDESEKEIFQLNTYSKWNVTDLRLAQKNDTDIRPVLDACTAGRKPEEKMLKTYSPATRLYFSQFDSISLDDLGLLRLQVTIENITFVYTREVLILPKALVKEVIMTAHAQLAHRAAKETCKKVRLHCYFPHMLSTVTEVLKFCLACQTKTTRLPDQRHTLVSCPPGYPWQVLSLDFVGPFPLSKPKGYKYLFTVKDTFTKWVEAFPIKKADTLTVLDILNNQIFSRFGKCERLHSDQGTQFTSHLFQEIADVLKIQVTYTPAYNPKSNPVERVHRDLKAALLALSSSKPHEWADHIPTILFAFRNSVSTATGYTPFQLMFGRNPIEDLDVLFPSPARRRELNTAKN